MRELLRDNGLPEPDSVLYDADELVLRWDDRKVVVLIELDG